MQNLFTAGTSLQLLVLAFLAILFLQSGLDKIFNYKANREWLEGHFKESFLHGIVGIMMPIITVLEVAAGSFSTLGIVQMLSSGSTQMGLIGGQLSALSILSLFFGQRIANDYEGAVNLVAYFIVSLICVFLMS